MKRKGFIFLSLLSLVTCWGIWSCSAYADVESAVVNNPTTGWDLTKDVVNYLEPGFDWIVPFNDGGPFNGTSGAVYTFINKGFPLASIRAGYGIDHSVYGGLSLDLPGLTARFLPESVKGLSPGVLNGAAALAAKYLRVGPVGGYNFDTNKPLWGISVGAAVTLKF